jgi:hypothetical protein
MGEFQRGAGQWIDEKNQLLAAAKAEHKRVADEIEKVYQLHFAGKLSPVQFSKKFDPLDQRRVQLEAEAAALEGAVAGAAVNTETTEIVIKEAKTHYAAWPTMSLAQKRRVVQELVDEIIVGDGELDIKLCYAPSSKNVAPSEHGGPRIFRRQDRQSAARSAGAPGRAG